MAILQARKGRDPFPQACAREVWFTCTIWDITLAIGHVVGESLGQVFKDSVSALLEG